MITWPGNLPQTFEKQGYTDELPEQLIGSPVELDDKVRREPKHSNLTPLGGIMIMSTSDWLQLQNFYLRDLVSGVKSFMFPDIDNEGQYVDVAFTQAPQFETIGGDLHRILISLQRQG